MSVNLETRYKETAAPALKEQFGYANVNQIPKIEKVVVNCGVGKAEAERKQAVQDALNEIALITGQRGVATIAKNSISNFKLRAGEQVGAKVTLRGKTMYEFLLRLIGTAIPRIRDFRGVKPSFDGRGNFATGLKEHIVFPEIDFDKVDENWGMDIIIATTANTDAEAKSLLKHFNMPFNA